RARISQIMERMNTASSTTRTRTGFIGPPRSFHDEEPLADAARAELREGRGIEQERGPRPGEDDLAAERRSALALRPGVVVRRRLATGLVAGLVAPSLPGRGIGL